MPTARLLVLDDDETVGQLLVFVAQSTGLEARLCTAAPAFFEAVAAWRPTHLAIDLSLARMHGLDVLRELAARGCDSRVIICSGAGRGEIDAAAREATALGLDTAGVLPKPFSVASLRALLGDVGPAPRAGANPQR